MSSWRRPSETNLCAMLGGAGEGRVASRGPGCHSQRCTPTDCCLMPAAAVLQACRCVGESDLSHCSACARRWIGAQTHVDASGIFVLTAFGRW